MSMKHADLRTGVAFSRIHPTSAGLARLTFEHQRTLKPADVLIVIIIRLAAI
jgi:hypothetical protein